MPAHPQGETACKITSDHAHTDTHSERTARLLTTQEVTPGEEAGMSRLCALPRGRRSVKVIRRVGAEHLGASCAQQKLPAPASNATKQARGAGGRAWREYENLPQPHTGGNYTPPWGRLCLSASPASHWTPKQVGQWKIHVFHFHRHIP